MPNASDSPGWLADYIAAERLPSAFAAEVERLHRPIAEAIARAAKAQDGLFVVGLCGSQGSGKSTMAGVLKLLLEQGGLAAATLSIDDLYRTHAERQSLAAEVHPLLATRGPPGTHDVALGIATLDSLAAGNDTALPRFDKANDDRLPRAGWPSTSGRIDVLIFEGWCVGACAEPEPALDEPLNALERDEDGDGRWRRFVNDALRRDYPALFDRIDRLILLAAPSWETVAGWREEQEVKLRARDSGGARVMSPDQVTRFVQYYERITRAILAEMPARADLVVSLDGDRRPVEVRAMADFRLAVP